MPSSRSISSAAPGDPPYLEFPSRTERQPDPPGDPPLIRVRQAVTLPATWWVAIGLHVDTWPSAPCAQRSTRTMCLRCRLSVHYRVHSRQMLCIGGSQIPFGWSFLSIAKVPMQWSEGDIWTTEVTGGCMGWC